MKLLIRLNLLLVLQLKAMVINIILFIFIAVFQAVFLKEFAENHIIGVWDYLLLSLGGTAVNDNMIRLHTWIIVIVPILFYVYHLSGVTGGYDLFVFSRVGTRLRWWIGKYISLFVIVLIYGGCYALVHFAIGILFFPFEPSWGTFIKEHFHYIFNLQQSPAQIIVLSLVTLVTGIVAYCTFAQSFALFFRKLNIYYILLTVVLIALYEFHAQGLLLREFSPFNYASFISVIQLGNQGLLTIIYTYIYNILFSLACFLLGLIIIRKSNLSVKQA